MAHQCALPVLKFLLTVPEAGRVLAISRPKVYDLLNSGSLPSVYIGRSRRVRASDVETMLRTGERRTEDLVELERIQDIADAADGSTQVMSVDFPSRDVPASSYHPFAGDQCGGLDVVADAWRELGV
jgi:excisionase family DNA binding protein